MASARLGVRRRVRRSGTSFYWAMHSLPHDRRDAIYAVYAYCREVDDIADGPAPLEEKHLALDLWRRRIDELYSGRSDNQITEALVPAVQKFDLERDAFLAIIDGMQMDAEGPIVAPTYADLKKYCQRVAGAVGLLCVRIFGETREIGRQIAESLGLALQLTNILRDLTEDAEMGRLYLPRELLDRHGVNLRQPSAVLTAPGIEAVCNELAGEAEQAFERAKQAIAGADERAMRPAIIMMRVYQKTFRRLRARGWTPDAISARESDFRRACWRVEKFAVALKYQIFG